MKPHGFGKMDPAGGTFAGRREVPEKLSTSTGKFCRETKKNWGGGEKLTQNGGKSEF